MSQKYKEILYHGTVSDIIHVDVSKGRGNKDFGKGFYMAVSKNQAVGMMHKKYHEVVRRNRQKNDCEYKEHLYQIHIDPLLMDQIHVKIFEKADEEWLDFVLMCREKKGVPHDYDVVIGPTADDDTLLCMKTYWDGLYGPVGSVSAKKILLNNLEPDRLGIQHYVGKQEIADRLIKEIVSIPWG